MIKLSIIIPIYKVEKFIVECLESVCCQLMEDIEVILVNDGTPDNSMLIARQYILDKYSHLKKQFVFIDQENQGQSIARNEGLKISTGSYVAFLDSDDVLGDHFVETVLNVLNNNDVDIIQFKSARFFEDLSDWKNFDVGLAKKNIIEQSSMKLMMDIFNENAWFPWLNIYKKQLLSELEFPSAVYFEDAILIPEVFLRAKNFFFLDDILYFYRINMTGSLLNNSNNNIEKLIKSYKFALNTFANRLKYNKIYSAPFVSFFQSYISFLYKKKGLYFAKLAYKDYAQYLKLVDLDKLSKKGNLLFFKFGLIFIIFLKLIGKL